MRASLSRVGGLVFIAAATGCAGGGQSAGPNLSVYKYFGSVQCTGGGTTLPAMEHQLTGAGVQVRASACGTDGKFYPAVCGASDGRIGIFEIPATQAQAASVAGFAPLQGLPAATKVPCR